MGVLEKDINLAIALELKNILNELSYKTEYSSDADFATSLNTLREQIDRLDNELLHVSLS